MPRVPPVTIATCAISNSYLSVPTNSAFDANRDAHAAANAHGGDALLRVPLLHLIKQRHQDAPAGSADRMTDGDRAAIHIDFARVPAKALIHRTSLGREGFV